MQRVARRQDVTTAAGEQRHQAAHLSPHVFLCAIRQQLLDVHPAVEGQPVAEALALGAASASICMPRAVT